MSRHKPRATFKVDIEIDEGGTTKKIELDIEECLDQFGLSEVVKEMGTENILTEIGIEDCMDHFGPKEVVSHLSGEDIVEYSDTKELIRNMYQDDIIEELDPQAVCDHFRHLNTLDQLLNCIDPEDILNYLKTKLSEPIFITKLIKILKESNE